MAQTAPFITAAQRRTLKTIQRLAETCGYAPTVGELAAELSLCKATVHAHLDKLIDKGVLRRTIGKARSLEIVRNDLATVIGLVAVPLLGNVAAGIPIEAIENAGESILVEANLIGQNECFGLKVVGDSMIDADIVEGDVLVVHQQPLAENGEIVVASLDGQVTVKRLSMKDGAIELLPENKRYEPIRLGPKSNFKILGRVIATRRVLPLQGSVQA
jgi:repressor LexA